MPAQLPPEMIERLWDRASHVSEFLRSYNRSTQTWRILSSFLYCYPSSCSLSPSSVTLPKQSREEQQKKELTDSLVSTSDGSEIFILDKESRTGCCSDQTQMSTHATGGSRTRSPSPDQSYHINSPSRQSFCVVDSEDPPCGPPCRCHQQLQTGTGAAANPANKFDRLRAIWLDTATTTIQRCWRGYLGRQRFAAERQWKQWHDKATESAIVIQRRFREILLQRKKQFEELCQQLHLKRQRAAMKIQQWWIHCKRREAEEFECMITAIRQMRDESAVALQRSYRGFKARQLLDLEHERWLITWKWDPPGKVVEVVGSFTTPPWTSRVPMSWDSMTRQYIVKLPRTPGTHELKFLVDGDFCCDGSLAVVPDGAGNYNNVVSIMPGKSESPFKRIRSRLRLKAKF